MTAHATGDKQDLPTQRPLPASAAPEHNLNPLQRLIRQRMRERGWSYGDVARRGGLPRSTVYTLAMTRNLGRPPRIEEAALGVAGSTPPDRFLVRVVVGRD